MCFGCSCAARVAASVDVSAPSSVGEGSRPLTGPSNAVNMSVTRCSSPRFSVRSPMHLCEASAERIPIQRHGGNNQASAECVHLEEIVLSMARFE